LRRNFEKEKEEKKCCGRDKVRSKDRE